MQKQRELKEATEMSNALSQQLEQARGREAALIKRLAVAEEAAGQLTGEAQRLREEKDAADAAGTYMCI